VTYNGTVVSGSVRSAMYSHWPLRFSPLPVKTTKSSSREQEGPDAQVPQARKSVRASYDVLGLFDERSNRR